LGLATPLERAERPSMGRKSDLLLIRPGRGEALAVRRIDDPREAAKLCAVYELLARHDLPTPRLRYRAASLGHWLRHRCAVLGETLIEGRTAGEFRRLDADALRVLGATLARFHAVTSPAWGEPHRPRRGDSFEGLVLRKFRNRLTDLETFGGELSPARRDRILNFVRRFRPVWGDGLPFVLTHDKLHGGNMIFTPGGGIVLLDWATARFGPAGTDLTELLERFCGDARKEAVLREAYFNALPGERHQHFHALEPLHRAYYHLSRWAAKERRLKKERWIDGSRETAEQAQSELWRWVDGDDDGGGRESGDAENP
jgi:aminoglycoside phosphotransferase (APT) family kinase protein